MYHRVKIKRLPEKALGGTKTGQQTSDGALSIQPTAMGGADIDQYIGEKSVSVKKTLEPTDRDKANVEVEKGEVVAGDLNGDGMIETYVAGGKRHFAGGTPLNLPDDTFIFSDTKSMKIKDKDILSKFGKSSGSYTPAQLAKQYDINKYRQILQDPNSDALDKKTAELMIRNYTMKLGGLALAQESKKAFPQGVPKISNPFLEANGISEEQIMPTYKPAYPKEKEGIEPQEEVSMDESMPTEMPSGDQIAMSPEMMQQGPMAAYGMQMGGFNSPFYMNGAETDISDNENTASEQFARGGLIKAQTGLAKAPYSEKEAYSPKGVVELNKYRKMYGLPQLKGRLTVEQIKAAAGELQAKIIETNPELVVDYMSQRSHKPNNELISKMSQKAKGYPVTTEGVKRALRDGKLSAEDVRGAYKDNLWWYRALETNTKELSPEEYEKKMKDPNAIKQGDILYFNEDPDNPQLYTQYVMKEGKKDGTIEAPEEDTEDVDTTTEEVDEYIAPPGVTQAQWMTPDVMNFLGTIRDKSAIRKRYPWAPPVDLEEYSPRYLDVTRPAAALAEQANIAQRNLSQFVGSPQAASARAMGIQGQLSKNVADLMSNYNNQNVNIYNQSAQANAGIRNQERMTNQGIAKQLYDQTNLMNQQYDNAQAAARQNIRNAFATGWKNASDLAMVNATSEQYDIDPVTGQVVFMGGKPGQPTRQNTLNDMLDYYENTRGYSPEEALKAAQLALKNPTGIDVDAIMQNAKNGGIYVMGDTIFPFMFY